MMFKKLFLILTFSIFNSQASNPRTKKPIPKGKPQIAIWYKRDGEICYRLGGHPEKVLNGLILTQESECFAAVRVPAEPRSSVFDGITPGKLVLVRFINSKDDKIQQEKAIMLLNALDSAALAKIGRFL